MLRGNSSVPIAMPLRMLEVFTDERVFSQSESITETEISQAVRDILLYLVKQGKSKVSPRHLLKTSPC